ncbi:transglycosylase [Kalmusia sp. IMI 367209]|nr:transglycosylase [Kalmusia sp. IMI 367209]
MRSTLRAVAACASILLLSGPATAQTYTNCNPTTSTSCPPDSALGKTVNIDFSSASDSFTTEGSPTYGSDGASFTVAKQGDNPKITSKWYIMFGQVDVELQAAPGQGIVSSFFLQSDCLDEIDWEWLGGDNAQVQSNYFGKGNTETHDRGAFHANPGNHDGFQKYSIIWTSEQIAWQINGQTVRTLVPANANGQYPQTPMAIKIGAWAGGDPSNSEGTIEWAGGLTDYTKGPYSMKVKSLKVQDYSTGTQYVYGDTSGTWGSIKSEGGKINSGGTPVEEDAPGITSAASGAPLPFTPHTSSDYTRPSVYPWVPDTTVATVATTTYGNYPGLPSGWSVSDSGKVVPPSLAPSTSRAASSTPSSQASPSASSGDSEQITTPTEQGFSTVYTAPAGTSSEPKSFDSKGFLITSAPSAPTASTSTKVLANNAVESSGVPPVPSASDALRLPVSPFLAVLLAAFIGVVSVLL